MNARERFYEKVRIDSETGCHLWTGAVSGNGYGNFWFGRTRPAHRVAWFFAHGMWPTNVLDHVVCQNPICVNVAHLEDVTYGVNTGRGTSPAARNDPKLCGREKHEWISENIGRDSRGDNYCKPCKADRQRERRAKKI